MSSHVLLFDLLLNFVNLDFVVKTDNEIPSLALPSIFALVANNFDWVYTSISFLSPEELRTIVRLLLTVSEVFNDPFVFLVDINDWDKAATVRCVKELIYRVPPETCVGSLMRVYDWFLVLLTLSHFKPLQLLIVTNRKYKVFLGH